MADGTVQTGEPPFTRLLADRLFSRVAGAELVEGNAIRLLRDASENYPAWLDAIAAARDRIQFENYIVKDDEVGRRFARALGVKAQEGVRVRLLYDWMGCFATPDRFWQGLRAAGVDVRCFNTPRIDSPLGWLSRNHRKSVSVDGEVGFVAGLCIGQEWEGDPSRRKAPWRDTGVMLKGPAVLDLERAFEQSWARAGRVALPAQAETPPAAGTVAVRVIGSQPNAMGLYRLDQLIAGLARRRLFLTDAYFVGTTSYVRTLQDAARDGVDVRLLVPGTSDIALTQALSRAGYRPLLEAGIRVYEWNGPMLHAKTAVADGRWARIGSSNLNLASWIGNWELDVAVEDQDFAAEMESMFLDDLGNATEIVLRTGRRIRSADPADDRVPRRGSPGRLAAGAVGIGSAVSAAVTNHRVLGPAEARVMAAAGGSLLGIAAVAVAAPRVLTFPLAVICLWIAAALLIRAWRLHRRRS